MMIKRLMIAVLALAGALTGFVQYPMGLSEAQWNALPPAQQAEYQAKQYQINEDRRRQAEALQAEQVRAAAQAAEAERVRIANVYAAAQYGDIITVSIRGGIISYGAKAIPASRLVSISSEERPRTSSFAVPRIRMAWLRLWSPAVGFA